MNCKDIEGILSAQPLAALTPDQRAAVSAHVAACAACRERWGLDAESQVFHDEAKALRRPSGVKDAVLAKLGSQEPTAAVRPSRIGGFELLAPLGHGGMGTVFKARQVSMDRIVALKVLPPNLAKDEAFVARFLREARSAAKLNHPNIVQGYDAGEADGVYYFAMEFVDGPTVKTLIQREGRIEEKRALTIVGAIARGLDEAHRHGLIHRDVKPENVMINSRGIVKLADLGLARSEAHGYEDTVTREGTVVGTPHYMAPEQARGDPDIDTRADIYALGATLYHMVTGEFPYSGPTPAAIMAKHITEPVPNPREKNPALSPATSHLVQRMMAKNPGDRPQSPAELLAEVRDALEGKIKLRSAATRTLAAQGAAEASPPVHRVHSVHSPARRRALPWLLSAAGLLLAAVAGFLLLRPGSGTPPPLSNAPRSSSPVPAEIRPVDPPKPTPGVRTPEVPSVKEQPLLEPKAPEANAPLPATVSFTAPSERKGLAAIPGDDGRFTIAEREGKPALCQEVNNPSQFFIYFRAEDDFAKLFQADPDKRAIVTISLLDTAAGVVGIDYDSYIEYPGEPEKASIFRSTMARNLRGSGLWTEVEFELPGARFGHRQNNEADFRLRRSTSDSPSVVHRVTVSAVEEEQPPRVPTHLEQGVAAAFYEGQNHERFVVARRASAFAFNWHDFPPAPNVPAEHFSTRIVGWLYIPEAGVHTFTLRRDDGGRLYLDGNLLIDRWVETDFDPEPAIVRLGAGWHRVWVEHMNIAQEAHIALYWHRGQKERLVPHTLLYCERDMLEAIRRDPTQDPFAGLKPETPVKAPDEAAAGPKWQVYKDWPFDAAEAVRRHEATAKVLGVKAEQEFDLGNGVKMAFALIPAGEFLMGSPPTTSPQKLAAAYGGEPKNYECEFPQHRVTISRPFWMGKTDVTQEQYMAILGTNPSGHKDKPKNPVEHVDWKQASGFAKALGEKLHQTFRLPTEAEWEYACRAGAATEFYFGDDAAKVPDFGWCGSEGTAPVGAKKPNAWGLCDMAGNVWEWVEDWFGPYEGGAQTDPKGPPAGELRGLRGGSWGYLPRALRSAYRNAASPEAHGDGLGFRVALELGPPEEPKAAVKDLKAGQWEALFDGKSLRGWNPVGQGRGPTVAEEGQVLILAEQGQCGMVWRGAFPRLNYEVTLEAMRIAGPFDFCDIVFPIGDQCAAWGFGGGPTGNHVTFGGVNGGYLPPDEAARITDIQNARWYKIRIRVTEDRVEGWMDDVRKFDLPRAGTSFSIGEDRLTCLKPFGIGTWYTQGAVRNLQLRRLRPGKEAEGLKQDK